jgi:hypothetical protein
MAEQNTLDASRRPDAVEEAGETTAADSVTSQPDTRPVGEDAIVEVEGEDEPE